MHILQNTEYGTTKTEISYEVEANLIQYQISKELDDIDNFLRVFSDEAYKQNFIDFAEGTKNSIGDFNNLIDNFRDGKNGGTTYDHYDDTHIQSFDDIIIDDLIFNN